MIYDINIFKKRSKKGLQNRSRAFIIANVPSEHAGVAQLVEHVIGNDEVVSSNLITSSIEALPCGVLLFCFRSKRLRSKNTAEPEKTAYSIGRIIVNSTSPSPVFFAETLPWCRDTILLTSESPSPLPSDLCEVSP